MTYSQSDTQAEQQNYTQKIHFIHPIIFTGPYCIDMPTPTIDRLCFIFCFFSFLISVAVLDENNQCRDRVRPHPPRHQLRR